MLFLPSLVGSTGSAKTQLACLVAEQFPIEIIGADSRQIYRGFDVGTAKPSAEERARAPHHLVDFLDPREVYSAARFGEDARRVAAEIAARRHIPLLVGGSGLYVRAAEQGLFEGPSADAALRGRLEARARAEGVETLHAELQHVDPAAAARIRAGDLVRIVRALEVFEITGTTISEHQSRHRAVAPKVRALRFGIAWGVPQLAQRIERRVESMLQCGWIEEVRDLLESGVPENAPAWNALGYRTVRDVVRGALSRDDAAARVAAQTRRFAKRQRTWFRAQPETCWFHVASEEELPRVAHVIAGALRSAAPGRGPLTP